LRDAGARRLGELTYEADDVHLRSSLADPNRALIAISDSVRDRPALRKRLFRGLMSRYLNFAITCHLRRRLRGTHRGAAGRAARALTSRAAVRSCARLLELRDHASPPHEQGGSLQDCSIYIDQSGPPTASQHRLIPFECGFGPRHLSVSRKDYSAKNQPL
jgi:hypothetical protein